MRAIRACAFSARGKPANRYVCRRSSSIHSGGVAGGGALQLGTRHRPPRVPASDRGDSRTSDRVASSRCDRVSPLVAVAVIARTCGGAKRRSGNRPDLADDLAARVADRPRAGTPRAAAGASRGSASSSCSTRRTRRKLRALRAVLDLDRDPDALLRESATECTPSAPIFATTRPSVSSMRIESKRSVPPTRNGRVCIAPTMRLEIPASCRRRARESRVGARHVLERHREHDDAASVDRDRRCRPSSMPVHCRHAVQAAPLHVVPAARSRTSASPAVCARASIAACFPEQLL